MVGELRTVVKSREVEWLRCCSVIFSLSLRRESGKGIWILGGSVGKLAELSGVLSKKWAALLNGTCRTGETN